MSDPFDGVQPAGLREAIREALGRIDDPEMPISIVDLGIIAGVTADNGQVTVRITPTFTGCPALEMIHGLIRQELGRIPGVAQVRIETVFDPPWTAERISDAGKLRLREHGITTPRPSAGERLVQLGAGSAAPVCPYCHSTQTRLDSPFGPTRCRQIHYCPACHNSFEHIRSAPPAASAAPAPRA